MDCVAWNLRWSLSIPYRIFSSASFSLLDLVAFSYPGKGNFKVIFYGGNIFRTILIEAFYFVTDPDKFPDRVIGYRPLETLGSPWNIGYIVDGYGLLSLPLEKGNF